LALAIFGHEIKIILMSENGEYFGIIGVY